LFRKLILLYQRSMPRAWLGSAQTLLQTGGQPYMGKPRRGYSFLLNERLVHSYTSGSLHRQGLTTRVYLYYIS
jgi:hypothetical protein